MCICARLCISESEGWVWTVLYDWVCVSCHRDRMCFFFFSISGQTLLAAWPRSADSHPITERGQGPCLSAVTWHLTLNPTACPRALSHFGLKFLAERKMWRIQWSSWKVHSAVIHSLSDDLLFRRKRVKTGFHFQSVPFLFRHNASGLKRPHTQIFFLVVMLSVFQDYLLSFTFRVFLCLLNLYPSSVIC